MPTKNLISKSPDYESIYQTNYDRLNDAQKKAVDYVSGSILIMAGPGSGKTQVLAMRITNILRQVDIEPENILCLTYTDAGAINMRKRLINMAGDKGAKVSIFTFHSFCKEQISNYPELFFDGQTYAPVDEIEAGQILIKVLEKIPRNNILTKKNQNSYLYLDSTARKISNLKREGLTPSKYEQKLKSFENFMKSHSELESIMNMPINSKISKSKMTEELKIFLDRVESEYQI